MSLVSNTGTLTITAAGSLPSWVPASAGTWVQIPNTALSSVPPSPVPAGNTGPSSKIVAWTSFAVDRRTSKIYSVANGGHNDYSGNEVDVWTLETNTPGVAQVRAPSASVTANVSYYGDGKPTSRHSYYGVTFDETTGSGRVLLWNGANWSTTGSFHTAGDAYNLNTNDYSAAGTMPSVPTALANLGGGFACCADHRNGNVYFWGGFDIYKYTVIGNTMTTISTSSGMNGRNSASAFDTTRNRFFIVGGDTSVHHTFDPATNTLTNRTLSGTAAANVSAVLPGGMGYDPTLDAFILRPGGAGGTTYQINAGTFACTAITTTGGTSIPATQNGPYNKALFCPNLGGIFYCPDYSTNAWFLRTSSPAPTVLYQTDFNTAENPLSEGGNWTNPASALFTNAVQTTAGHAIGPTSSGNNDAIRMLANISATNYSITGVVFGSPAGAAEIELLLRCTSANTSDFKCYECDIIPSLNVLNIEKWLGNQTVQTPRLGSVALPTVSPGDVFKATISGNTITVFKNGVQLISVTDNSSPYTTGKPGIGFDAGSVANGQAFGWESIKVETP